MSKSKTMVNEESLWRFEFTFVNFTQITLEKRSHFENKQNYINFKMIQNKVSMRTSNGDILGNID